MLRKRQETNRTKIARMLIEEYKPNTVKDIQDITDVKIVD